MNKIIYSLAVLFLFAQCKNSIKNDDTKVVQEDGAQLPSDSPGSKSKTKTDITSENFTSFWVGYFNQDVDESEVWKKKVSIDGTRDWYRENKISISIDKIEGDSVKGHSVVAGNRRTFTGMVKKEKGGLYFEVNEAGDDKYDGAFKFHIIDTTLEGKWSAFKKIEIPKRKYTLTKKVFKYNPDIMLETTGKRKFVNWGKMQKNKADDGQGYYPAEFAMATHVVYEYNASVRLLSKTELENMNAGDLLVIRNTIYARHGFSFKNRYLRIFFDSQDWYIPVYTDIKNELTDIEKANIKVLLRYEKTAKEYYDSFGR